MSYGFSALRVFPLFALISIASLILATDEPKIVNRLQVMDRSVIWNGGQLLHKNRMMILQDGKCKVVNDHVVECEGGKRNATPADRQAMMKYAAMWADYIKNVFPEGFPLVYPDRMPPPPVFPKICKTCPD